MTDHAMMSHRQKRWRIKHSKPQNVMKVSCHIHASSTILNVVALEKFLESKSGHWFITTKFAMKQWIVNSINITVKDIIICTDHAVCSHQTLLFTIPQMVSVQFPLFYLVSSQNKTLVKLRTLSLLANLFLSCSTWILTFCT
jgi:hypothetical protein